jgi:hypothetical protein
VLTHTIPLPAGGGALVPADGEVFAADFAGAELLAAGAGTAAEAGAAVFEAAAGFDAAGVPAAGAAAVAASALALLFLLLVAAGVAAGAAAGVVAAGALEDPGAALSVASAAAFFDRVFFAVAAESLDASGAAVASAAVFFDRDFLAVVPESLDASGLALASAAVFFDRDFFAVAVESAALAEESPAAAFVDFAFFVLLAESAALSVVPALESAEAAVFFLDLLFDVPLVEESEAFASESAVVAFFVFFFGVLVVLSALESLDVSCARTSVVNTNKPISAATTTRKALVRRVRFILISM